MTCPAFAIPRFIVHDDLVQACSMFSDNLQVGDLTSCSAFALRWLESNTLVRAFTQVFVGLANVVKIFFVYIFREGQF